MPQAAAEVVQLQVPGAPNRQSLSQAVAEAEQLTAPGVLY